MTTTPLLGWFGKYWQWPWVSYYGHPQFMKMAHDRLKYHTLYLVYAPGMMQSDARLHQVVKEGMDAWLGRELGQKPCE